MEGDTVLQNLRRKRRHDDKTHGDNDRGRPRSQQRRKKHRMHDTKSQNSLRNAIAGNYKVLVKVTCSVCNVADPKYKCPKCRSTYCSIDCCRKHKEELCSNVMTEDTAQVVNQERQGDDTVVMQKYKISKYLTKSEFAKISSENKMDLNDLKKKQQEEVEADEDLSPGWQMTQDMVKIMRKSKWLKDELSDCGLQKLILNIVSSSGNIVNANRRGYASSQQSKQSTTTYREQMLSDIKSQYPQFQIFVNKLLYLTGIYDRCDDAEIDEKTPIDEWLINTTTCSNFTLKPLPQRNRPSDPSLTVPCENSETDSESVSSESENHDESDDATNNTEYSEESSTA